MRRLTVFLKLSGILLAVCVPVAAQLSPAQTDPLSRIREAAQGNTQACSATGETLCEQVAPKIIANAQGDSPLAENLRQLNDRPKVEAGPEVASRVVNWATGAFHEAGVDFHTEKYADRKGGPADQENVVAEIRGREKPDEWVLVGAHLDAQAQKSGAADDNCDAAIVIEAARDIARTGIYPRRSIRFVLFTGEEKGMPGSWAYTLAHRAELDRARAAIVLGTGCSRMTGYSLNGRHDIEPGVREAMKPIESMGAGHNVFNIPMGNDGFDFVVEGVPTLIASDENPDSHITSRGPGAVDFKELKRDTAVVAVTAFGIAERAEPIGPRQSRNEIESLIKTAGLDQEMKAAGLWPLWESGKRGRFP